MVAARTAVVAGAALPFGAEIIARLTADGYLVTAFAGNADVTASALPDAIDALVLNAPVAPDALAFADVTDADFRRAIEQQFYGPVATIQAAAPRMAGGAIVQVASVGHLGAWGGVHQMAAGGAMVGMNRSVALEYADRGIRANLLAPDFAGEAWDTPAARALLAGAVAWLAGPDSALISGEVVIADMAHCLRLAQSVRR